MKNQTVHQRAQEAWEPWTASLGPGQQESLRVTMAAQRRNDKDWRGRVTCLDSDDLDELAAKQHSLRGRRAAPKSPGAGVEAKDLLAYLAKHLNTAELAALKAQAAGEPTDKDTLRHARRKAKHALLVMK